MLVRMICLANSRKNANRCVAGLTPAGRWIRPTSKLVDGSITRRMRLIDGEEPNLLDILSIPLATTGPDFGHQTENRSLIAGEWICHGRATVADVTAFCSRKRFLLHSSKDRVTVAQVNALAKNEKRSLQLISVRDASFYSNNTRRDALQSRVRFTHRGNPYDLVVTDPIAERRIEDEKRLSPQCLLTVSMGGPYGEYYYKFVAAVMEL